LVPITSLLVAGRLIARFGAAPVVTAGVFSFVAGLAFWATVMGQESNMLLVTIGMIPIGIGVGLTFPTLMGIGSARLPSSAFATGSGVINMIRQAALAVGVAIFVAIIGTPSSLAERVTAFHRGWWIMASIAALGLIPNYIFIRPKRK
jgi:MFS family permease